MYAPSLRQALRHKWVTVVMPIALVMVTVGLIGGGFIGLTFFPFLDGDTLPVNVTLVPGRQEADTDSLLSRIERVAETVGTEMSAERSDGRQLVMVTHQYYGSSLKIDALE